MQKQRDLLKKDVTVLECKINELRDILELKNIKKGYYTNNLGLFCKVYDIKGDNIHGYYRFTKSYKGNLLLEIF